MKQILIPLLSLIYFVYCQGDLDSKELGKFSDHEKECIEELHSDKNMILNALKKLYLPENNAHFNAFMECTWKKDGFIEENGTISYERFFYYVKGAYLDAVGIPDLAEPFATDTISRCKGERGNTPGQTGVKLMNCILRTLYT